MLNGYTAVEGKATTQENGKPSEKKKVFYFIFCTKFSGI
jgi:hypothetical protein